MLEQREQGDLMTMSQKSFDKHVNQSIPHYKELQLYISSLAEWFIKDGS